MRQSKITCVDPEACTPKNCRFVGGNCDQEYWKLLISEGIKVGQSREGRQGLTFSKDGVDILHVSHECGFGKEGIHIVCPDMVPTSLLELLKNRDIAELVSKTNGRILRMTKLIIDYREPKSLIRELAKKHEVEIKQLITADYIIQGIDPEGNTLSIGIERKTNNDFLNSIIDKRIIQQLIYLKNKLLRG